MESRISLHYLILSHSCVFLCYVFRPGCLSACGDGRRVIFVTMLLATTTVEAQAGPWLLTGWLYDMTFGTDDWCCNRTHTQRHVLLVCYYTTILWLFYIGDFQLTQLHLLPSTHAHFLSLMPLSPHAFTIDDFQLGQKSWPVLATFSIVAEEKIAWRFPLM